jgi:hypothetical protein
LVVRVGVTIYKRGFIGGENILINDKYRGVAALEDHKFQPDDELEHIREVALNLNDCDNSYESAESIQPVVDALKADAALVAVTPRQLADATYLLMSPAEAIALAQKGSPEPVIEQRIGRPPSPQQGTAAPR